jgi:hypothetical protein
MILWKNFNRSITNTAAICVALIALSSITAQAKVAVLDRVAAIVNDDIVLPAASLVIV